MEEFSCIFRKIHLRKTHGKEDRFHVEFTPHFPPSKAESPYSDYIDQLWSAWNSYHHGYVVEKVGNRLEDLKLEWFSPMNSDSVNIFAKFNFLLLSIHTNEQ